ncbi:preprotein translocase subunit SecA [Candidatus Roizmanbacteria bacterium RIFCSPHIGHO2_01_FULL_39_24]|uniref:Protein translocase subunit SecA n=1 Tax=Candidatus Roizmanbacteria bacterium RIFCSPHIGHO2_01_FULL_39_24 TaxID=1802032 RepID=A0A1F7GL49_9BACT|nr:MAG: preprotein translocase subunit SecA [Candidatus Roizmanbacteria bacterium RIFCSPHIGHO2_01_FULL_39_24]
MFDKIKSLFDYNKKEVDRLAARVAEINALGSKAKVLKDADFPKETDRLKKEIQDGKKTLEEVLPWAYAMVREAANRVLKTPHYDEQLMAGIALHEGTVAEQKTGEGKTLSATSPLYLNALTGRGVHLVTVNDYLARRDAGWMGQIFDFLGLTVGAMISERSFIFDKKFTDETTTDDRIAHLREVSRKEAYEADVTYGINSEFGFDYLRDNMAQSAEYLVQRGFHYAIIDEVDSVLIDEARTPHIISAPYDKDVSRYYEYAQIVDKLQPSDFVIDEKQKSARLTEEGIATIERILKVDNVYEKDFDTVFHVEAALKARTLFTKDKDYIVKDEEVIIVDEFTGRLLNGRRFSEGLHQAIEAKENVPIKQESRTLATVSLQNYFRMYEKLAGMTGTAATEAEEFAKIYKLNVIVFPTHRDNNRKDQSDLIFKTENGKLSAVVEEIAAQHKLGRPVLVGTTSIAKNEHLSSLLKKKGVPHELLNAKNHEREAHIISKAGEIGAVTVATNMAGRGVDIVLGGEESKTKDWQKKHDEIVALGGLYVLGTERHESRRIDNQLRGRSGRQGDPGETRFFVSLEDDLMRIFGGEQVGKLMSFFNIPEDQPLEHSMVTRAIEQSQVKVEGFNFDIRKHLVDYDDVLNKQREVIYKLRNQILRSAEKEVDDIVWNAFEEEVQSLVNMYIFLDTNPDFEKLAEEFSVLSTLDKKKIQSKIETIDKNEIADFLLDELEKYYDKRAKEVGADLWLQVLRAVYLSTIDQYWTEHLTAIDDLRDGIGFRGYAQLDPLVEYKNEAYTMFEKLLGDINYEVTRRLLRVEIGQEAPQVAQVNTDDLQLSTPEIPEQFVAPKQAETPQVHEHHNHDHEHDHNHDHDHSHEGHVHTVAPSKGAQLKLGRNDPCWCGSGKKYKRCHYPN